MFARIAAHGTFRLQIVANRRPFRFTEKLAEIRLVQVEAADTGRLAVRHSGDRGGNRRCNTARPAAWTALEGDFVFQLNWQSGVVHGSMIAWSLREVYGFRAHAAAPQQPRGC